MKKLYIILSVIACLASCSPPGEYKKKANNPEQLHRTVKKITDIIVHDIFSPPVANRIYSYTSIAAYEAARHQDSSLVSLANQLRALAPVPEPEPNVEYCFPLAAVQAALVTSKSFLFSEDMRSEFYNSIMKEYKDSGMPSDVYDRSIAYGTKVAEHIVAWSSKDNYKQTRSYPKYSVDDSPSKWKPTPPAYMDAVEPHWNKIRPFVLDSASEFRPSPPPDFSTDPKSEFYGYVKEVYETGKNLTDEQRAIANFWDCNPFKMNVKGHVMYATKKISPGGHWMNITHLACVKNKSDFAHSAEAYVKVAITLSDAAIICWDEKYRSLLIRPETYINQHIDEDWIPLLQTPPFPEYISGHSTFSGAASTTLTHVFGDNFSFTDSTEAEFGLPPRSFTSFNKAAEEAMISRLYGGIHYSIANKTGLQMGRKLGEFINERVNTRRKETAKL